MKDFQSSKLISYGINERAVTKVQSAVETAYIFFLVVLKHNPVTIQSLYDAKLSNDFLQLIFISFDDSPQVNTHDHRAIKSHLPRQGETLRRLTQSGAQNDVGYRLLGYSLLGQPINQLFLAPRFLLAVRRSG